MSSKNSLQEFCTKNNFSPPSYNTHVGGEAHNPRWFSIVTVKPSIAESMSVPGEVKNSKTEAEKSAAEYMLESLYEIQKRELDTLGPAVSIKENNVTSPNKISEEGISSGKQNSMVILIDVENMPNMIFPSVTLKQKHPKSQIDIFVCVGKHHHSVDKNFGKHVTKIIVPTTRKDGVDTFIQMYTGQLLFSFSYELYAIVTRDHFGHSLTELIGSTPGEHFWKGKRAVVVTTQEQLFQFFDENNT